MARPRIFISSTFYDLRYVRADLERFIADLGYESVMNERGQIAYGKTESLEQYCYREIGACDILINIVGSRFGSESEDSNYSISQMELKTAHELNKQIYVFVERPVHVEYRTWLLNRDNEAFQPQYVDDTRIYDFVAEIYALSLNNIVADFDSVSELIEYLREQWSGLFQRFLREESKGEDYKISSNLRATAETLAEIVKYTTRERDDSMKSIFVHGHPIFHQLASETRIRIRIQFLNLDELKTLMTTFQYTVGETTEESISFVNTYSGTETTVRIDLSVFDGNGDLIPVEAEQLKKEFVTATRREIVPEDIPF